MRIPVLTDDEIASLIGEPKPIRDDFKAWIGQMVNHAGQLQGSHAVNSPNGKRFGIYLRKSASDDNDFSIGLRWIRGAGPDVSLVRCNGWHAEHRNRLERGTPEYIIPENTYHVHYATERYLQQTPPSKIGYAVITDAFHCLASALEFFVERCGFVSSKTGKRFVLYPAFRESFK